MSRLWLELHVPWPHIRQATLSRSFLNLLSRARTHQIHVKTVPGGQELPALWKALGHQGSWPSTASRFWRIGLSSLRPLQEGKIRPVLSGEFALLESGQVVGNLVLNRSPMGDFPLSENGPKGPN